MSNQWQASLNPGIFNLIFPFIQCINFSIDALSDTIYIITVFDLILILPYFNKSFILVNTLLSLGACVIRIAFNSLFPFSVLMSKLPSPSITPANHSLSFSDSARIASEVPFLLLPADLCSLLLT